MALDQISKIWIKTHLSLGEEIYVFDWFRIYFIENNGAAWGAEIGGKGGKLFLTLFRLVAIVGIGYWLVQSINKQAPKLLLVSISLIFAGALGNILDSVFYGVLFVGGFEEALEKHKILFFFTPLIAAMAGNVGVQSSAIIVQGLANNNIKGSLWNRLMKEIGLSLVNGLILALLVVAYGAFQGFDLTVNYAIASSLIIVIIIAALIGTFVPIVLDKKGIDPALATGPFITTSNDIFGILIYFWIAKMMLGF